MSNTVITNYTDLNGPSTKADSSVVVIVNKDGSLSVDQKLLGTLMGTDGSQSAGISVVRVGHEGRPDDATDSESEDDKIPHVTLTVDSYYNEPNSIIKYDSGAEMLQSLRIETRENSLLGFQNDHCYTPLISPSQVAPQKERTESFAPYIEPVIQISHTPPPKPVPTAKKITILDQKIIPKGKKLTIKPAESPVIIKGNEALNKPLPVLTKTKELPETDKIADGLKRLEESTESSSVSSSGDSIADRDSDSDYKDQKVTAVKLRKAKLKSRILKIPAKSKSLDVKSTPKLKPVKNVRRDLKETKTPQKIVLQKDLSHKEVQKEVLQKEPPQKEEDIDLESLLPTTRIAVSQSTIEFSKTVVKQTPKPVKKEKKTPAHVTALLSDMTSLFSTPDVIRRVSTDNKQSSKPENSIEKPSTTKQQEEIGKSLTSTPKAPMLEVNRGKVTSIHTLKKNNTPNPVEKAKGCDLIPQIDEDSLAQILQDSEAISSPVKAQSTIATTSTMNSPGMLGPLSPTLDLLGGLPVPVGACKELEDGLTQDLLLHVAHLVQTSDKLQEVIDTQVQSFVKPPDKAPEQATFQQEQTQAEVYAAQTPKSSQKPAPQKEKPIEIVRRDGRIITLPPIEAPATRSSKRKSQIETGNVSITEPVQTPVVIPQLPIPEPIPEPQQVPLVSKQNINKKPTNKKPEQQVIEPPALLEKISAESQESWNSEDDPYRLWCICKQPHNNRFMICCDGCEDWFHGKCVNITKAMGQQMEEQGIEWRCPNCIKKTKVTTKSLNKPLPAQKKQHESPDSPVGTIKSPMGPIRSPMGSVKNPLLRESSKTGCIVCKKPTRASSIYCSDACILKHAQDSLGTDGSPTKPEAEAGKSQEKQKSDSRVIVYERKSGRLLAGPNAPTAENLKAWLQKNPTFEVVRPGALNSIKPGLKKKPAEPTRIQTTLNFERVPKKPEQSSSPVRVPQNDAKDRRLLLSRRDTSSTPPPRASPKPNPIQVIDTPRPSTSTAKPVSEPRKMARNALNRSLSNEKPPSASPTTSRRKESTPAAENRNKMTTTEPIRDNVRKSLQEQMSIRMKETEGVKFTEDDIQQFAVDTENELHDLFRDTGMKYKAKYRSLMFNIKDRKNLSLWEKICDKSITPQQLVRLSPEELASQELAEWRDQESKHQLELIKKSELDLLAASKTYVLKTHKGEEVMETKESVSTELDPNVAVEDLVIALNDSTVGEEVTREVVGEASKSKPEEKKKESKSKKRERDESSGRPKKRRHSSPAERRKSTRDSDRKSRSSRRKSDRDKESRSERRSTRRTDKKSRARSISRDRSKRDSKDKSDSERSRHRSRSREKVKRSKSREHSRSASKGRERSCSRGRSRRRSHSKDSRRRHSSRSKHISDEKSKPRSRSQDNSFSKIKTDSTDSDSIERPKSASLKDPHPEYDPHEPMITSAFSEEDLRKSEDAFEDTYKNEILDSGIEYDPSKMFTLDSSILPSSTFNKPENSAAAETESDQEPSSTVENAAATVWNGCINMVDVARFYVSAHEVSGSALDLEEELNTELDIVGRINPETVWDYINKTKKASNKDIILLRLQAANDEEKMQYIALYSYLSSRNRLGVVKVPHSTTVKDFYIIPLPANTSLPPILTPFTGPGIGDVKTHLLIAVIVRQRKKRMIPHIPKDVVPAKVARESRKRSYTPPVSKSSYTPPTSPRRRALPLPTYPASSLSTSVKDKIAASLACADDEAYSPGGSSNSSNSVPMPAVIAPPAPTNVLRTKMEELNRQIEEQKQQILKMAQADSSVGNEDDEAYSPSRPMTPPPSVSTLADIALPSNLHEILATIKQRSETQSTDVDMRNLPLP